MTVPATGIEPDLSSRPFRLCVERAMAASSRNLYAAWTQRIDSWFARPGSVLMTPAVNQPFFFETEHAGERHPHYGRFLRLEPACLIELTWLTAGGTHGAETVVRVDLTPKAGGTALRLTHSGFPDEQTCRRHEEAWPQVLGHLDRVLRDAADKTPGREFRSTRDVIVRSIAWDRVLDFYGSVLSLPVAYRSDDLVGFETGSFLLYVERSKSPGSSHGAVFEFLTPDLADARQRLLAAGCVIEEENSSLPRCYIRDPFGLVFNIGQTRD
jgi:uncharacterized protein YndB with AHSA1/START domain